MNELEQLLRRMQADLERSAWFAERSELIDLLITAIHRERSESSDGGEHERKIPAG
jgi:hypothetical protein